MNQLSSYLAFKVPWICTESNTSKKGRQATTRKRGFGVFGAGGVNTHKKKRWELNMGENHKDFF